MLDSWPDEPAGTGEAPPPLTLDLGSWEGPLDLLLSLARAQKVDLREISILALVDQYADYLGRSAEIALEQAADYLVMAAWLAYLKSCLLLPRTEYEDPEPDALAFLLKLRLRRLEAMREAGVRLMAQDLVGRDVFLRPVPEGLRTDSTVRWKASLYDLLDAYSRIQARTAPVLHEVARRPVMTIEAAMTRIDAIIGTMPSWTTIATFLPQPCRPALRRSALASTVVAALELARRGTVELRQDTPFGPVMLKAA